MCICVKFAHRDVCRIVNNINLSDCQFSVTRPYTDIILPLSECQWSFRGGTRGNAVPIVKIPLERMGTALPLLSYGENAYILHKMHFAVQKYVFLTLKYGKTRWRPGLRPGPRWGSLRRSPNPYSRLGRGHPSPDPTPLSAFGARYSGPSAPRFGAQFWRSHCC